MRTQSATAGSREAFWLSGLVLVYWLTRLVALDSLPFFIDEANHAWWARWVWWQHPFQAAQDGRLLNVLWMAVFWPFNAGVWLPRGSVLLITTAGLAFTLACTRRLVSGRAAVIAGLLYIFLPLTFFFERMALADSISAPFVAGALWAIARCQTTPHDPQRRLTRNMLLWAALGGVALTAAIFVKISNLIFLCLPLLAAGALFKLRDWRRAVAVAGAMYAGCFFTLAPSAWVVKTVGQSDLGLRLLALKTQAPLAALPQQIQANSLSLLTDTARYFPFPMWLIITLGMGLALWRGGRTAWFLVSVLAVTVGALIVRTIPGYLESRFLPVYAPAIAILAGTGLARLTAQWKPAWLVMGAVLVLGPGALFMWQGWTRPDALPLPENDRWQYIRGWPSGYGFRELAHDLLARHEATQLIFIDDLGGQQRLEAYLLGRTDSINIQQYSSSLPAAGSWFVIDSPKYDGEMKALGLQTVEVARYGRPGGESALVVYQVNP